MKIFNDNLNDLNWLPPVRFKGGSTTTQSRTIPNQTAQESALQTGLYNYGNNGLNNAINYRDQGNSALNNTFNPNWQQAYNDYNSKTLDALSSYDNYMNGIQNKTNQMNTQDLNDFKNTSGGLLDKYNTAMSGISDNYATLSRGELPTAYAENRKRALNSDLEGTVGNSINSLGSRGILNSSVTTGALNQIEKNSADTLAKNFTNDLMTQAGLLNNQATNTGNIYNTGYNQAKDTFNNGNTTANNYYNTNSNTRNNMYDRSVANAQSNFNNLAGAQGQSYYQPSQMFDYANNSASSAQNLFNTMYSGRMGTAGTTQTTSGGNSTAGLIGTLGSAAILCFVAGTKISTPNGDKNIEYIKPGDEVYSIDKEIETVTEVQKPCISPNDYMIVITPTKSVRPTSTQPFITTDGDILATELVGKELVGFNHNEKVIAVLNNPNKETVYDFKTTGSNTYFANGFAVRGM